MPPGVCRSWSANPADSRDDLTDMLESFENVREWGPLGDVVGRGDERRQEIEASAAEAVTGEGAGGDSRSTSGWPSVSEKKVQHERQIGAPKEEMNQMPFRQKRFQEPLPRNHSVFQ